MNAYLSLTEEVTEAIKNNIPVVALESTIIAHGMPYPKNVETALMVEEEVRKQGAVPATIAIFAGQLKAGLSLQEIESLGKEGQKVMKVSRRDLPFVLVKGWHGATTVATTMMIAEMAGIRIFATGGIGGVHRGAEISMDVSADLQELSKTKVAVVSAGAKAILDLALTLEYLETLGVPVVGYQTDHFPAFYIRKSGYKVPSRLDKPEEIAMMLSTHWGLGLSGGILIANPIPIAAELKYESIQNAIALAIQDSVQQKIHGKELTPFLLSRIVDLTGGESLSANIELVKNNARLAAIVAGELVKLNT